MKKIIIYTTPNCPYCKYVKEYFDEKEIKYEEKDVSEDDGARDEMIEKSGGMSVPVIEIGENVLVGFNKVAINRALR